MKRITYTMNETTEIVETVDDEGPQTRDAALVDHLLDRVSELSSQLQEVEAQAAELQAVIFRRLSTEAGKLARLIGTLSLSPMFSR